MAGTPLSKDQPELMRAFLFVGASIDEAMRERYMLPSDEKTLIRAPLSREEYKEFGRHFSFPEIEPHNTLDDNGSRSPYYLIYDRHGVLTLTDWYLCSQVAETLIGLVRSWLEARPNFQQNWTRFRSRLWYLVSAFERHEPDTVARIVAALKEK